MIREKVHTSVHPAPRRVSKDRTGVLNNDSSLNLKQMCSNIITIFFLNKLQICLSICIAKIDISSKNRTKQEYTNINTNLVRKSAIDRLKFKSMEYVKMCTITGDTFM